MCGISVIYISLATLALAWQNCLLPVSKLEWQQLRAHLQHLHCSFICLPQSSVLPTLIAAVQPLMLNEFLGTHCLKSPT